MKIAFSMTMTTSSNWRSISFEAICTINKFNYVCLPNTFAPQITRNNNNNNNKQR